MNNKWFILSFRKKFLDFKGNKYWTSGRKTQQDSQNRTQQVHENSLVFAISFFERERTSVRNVNWIWLFCFKKVTTLFGWLSSTSLKKPKSIRRQTPGCFASRSLVNMPFRKMEKYCSERNFFGFLKIESQKRSVFFGDLLLQEQKRSLWKRKIT